MALMESIKIPLGSRMPDFRLADPSGKIYSSDLLYGAPPLTAFDGQPSGPPDSKKGLLVVFTCNHCPYAQALWGRVIEIGRLADILRIGSVAINPNINPDYPDDAPEAMQQKIQELKIPFPYLVDETQEVARAFGAQCTPDLYLYNARHELVYHGRVDDNWKDAAAVTSEELKMAIKNLAEGKPISADQKAAMGCSIKWRG